MEYSNQHIGLISKYLSKQTNAEEERLLSDWIEKDKQNQLQFDEFKKAWEVSETHFDPEIDAINIDEEWSKMELEISNTKTIDILQQTKKFRLNWMQIAASISILLLIGSGLFYIFNTKETVLAAGNELLENTLPDGSIITLNQHSNITYNSDFNKKYREVKLLGEAYFKVQPDKSKPFVVRAGKLNVEVVGTAFYIKNFQDSNSIEVIVESGIVILYDLDNQSDNISLKAGESAKFDKENSRIIKSVNPETNTIAWKTKVFVFEEATFEQIINTLNDGYGSQIIIMNEDLKKCLITVTFNNQSIESVLKVFSATLDIQVENKGKIIEISGNACGNEKKE